jgi:hypothetical protein
MRGYPASLQYGFRKTSAYSVASTRHPVLRWTMIVRGRWVSGSDRGESLSDWALATGYCISRRNREEIPGSLGGRGCAVCDVVGAGSNSSPSSNSGASASPGAGRDPNSSNRQNRASAPVSALRNLWRRYVRRGWSFQRRTLGRAVWLGRFFGTQRHPLAGLCGGRRPILWNLEDSVR